MTKVRLTTQIQGDRGGVPWPAAGEEIDLPDAEAQSLIAGGSAVDPADKRETVLVPPAGIHTPGLTAMPKPGDSGGPLVEVPADAASDPEGVRKALADRDAGNFVEAPSGIALQKSSGAAMTREELDKAGKAEEKTREALGAAPADKTAKAKP